MSYWEYDDLTNINVTTLNVSPAFHAEIDTSMGNDYRTYARLNVGLDIQFSRDLNARTAEEVYWDARKLRLDLQGMMEWGFCFGYEHYGSSFRYFYISIDDDDKDKKYDIWFLTR